MFFGETYCGSNKLLKAQKSFEFSEEIGEEGDSNILYYIAGFVARPVKNFAKCEFCVELLVLNSCLPPILFGNEEIPAEDKEKVQRLTEKLNRGGLIKPSDLTFITVLHLWQLYNSLMDSEDLKNRVLESCDPIGLFSAL